jgi:hypothetical protein
MRGTPGSPANIKFALAIVSFRRAMECQTDDSQTTSRNHEHSKSQALCDFIFDAEYTGYDGDEKNNCG